jgi:2-polyprenyl-6-methoxyphenol hydroxylase-like FAD-dependent oxidoreductase
LVDPGDARRARFVHPRRHGDNVSDHRENTAVSLGVGFDVRPEGRGRDGDGRGRPDRARVGEHAVVLGGSLAGLAAAAALAERFHRVTIVERDTLQGTDGYRRGVSQGRHLHILLPAGRVGLAELLPGVVDDLRARDARVIDTTQVRFHIAGGTLLLEDADLDIVSVTRPLLESVVRDRVWAQPGVRSLEGQDARGLVTTPDQSRVTGVRLGSRDSNAEDTLAGDLVVDATGRSSRSPQWVADLGYPSAEEERLQVGVHYTTRLFRREPGDFEGRQAVVVTIPSGDRRGGALLAVEGDRWLVTLVGLLGERPPADLDGFVKYARTLWVGDLHEIVAAAEPLGEASTGGFPSHVRRRYDRLRRFPDRYVVTGDAMCSLNPVYAQGMSVAIGEARALGQVLDRHGLDGVGPRFFQRTRPIVDAAWTMATGADLGYPAVHGPRPVHWRLMNAYLNRLLRVAHCDPVVARAFMAVNGMVAPPQHLMRPRIVSRVFTGGRGPARKSAYATVESAPGRRR